MELNSKQVLNIRKKFRWIFITSLILVAATSLVPLSNQISNTPATNLTQLVALASLFTSVITGLGLIISNAIAWKKELRERGNFELDAEKKRLEIEKLRRELNALKAKGNVTVLPSTDSD